jgi:L-seryl-tRNA(Ser) seleniumtransferase
MLGRADGIEAVRRHPMARALRIDKLSLAALHATLIDHATPERALGLVAARASTPQTDLLQRASAIIGAVGEGLQIRVVSSEATWGGGALPESCIESAALVLHSSSAEAIVARLRRASPPVVGRVVADEVWLDLRTVAAGEDRDVIAALRACIEPPPDMRS